MATRAELQAAKRTKRQIAADLAAILALPELHLHTRRGIAWKMIWDFTEVGGKWHDGFAWSVAAAKLKAKSEGYAGLRREHSYPMRLAIPELLAVESPTLENVLPLLERAAQICVLTEEEDKALNKKYKSGMPKDAAPNDRFARYRAMGLAIVGDELQV